MFWKNTITKKDIESLNEDQLEQKIILYLDKKTKSGDKSKFLILSKGQQMFYATWWLEAEVNNGGFSQYFWNSASSFTKEAYYGYLSIGAKDHAKLAGEGMTVFVKNHPLIKTFLENRTHEGYKELEKLKLFDDLDKRFFDKEKKENILNLRNAYIKTHMEEFITK